MFGFEDELQEEIAILKEELEYWKTRCKLSERCNEESPCDSDATFELSCAYHDYDTFLESNKKYQ